MIATAMVSRAPEEKYPYPEVESTRMQLNLVQGERSQSLATPTNLKKALPCYGNLKPAPKPAPCVSLEEECEEDESRNKVVNWLYPSGYYPDDVSVFSADTNPHFDKQEQDWDILRPELKSIAEKAMNVFSGDGPHLVEEDDEGVMEGLQTFPVSQDPRLLAALQQQENDLAKLDWDREEEERRRWEQQEADRIPWQRAQTDRMHWEREEPARYGRHDREQQARIQWDEARRRWEEEQERRRRQEEAAQLRLAEEEKERLRKELEEKERLQKELEEKLRKEVEEKECLRKEQEEKERLRKKKEENLRWKKEKELKEKEEQEERRKEEELAKKQAKERYRKYEEQELRRYEEIKQQHELVKKQQEEDERRKEEEREQRRLFDERLRKHQEANEQKGSEEGAAPPANEEEAKDKEQKTATGILSSVIKATPSTRNVLKKTFGSLRQGLRKQVSVKKKRGMRGFASIPSNPHLCKRDPSTTDPSEMSSDGGFHHRTSRMSMSDESQTGTDDYDEIADAPQEQQVVPTPPEPASPPVRPKKNIVIEIQPGYALPLIASQDTMQAVADGFVLDVTCTGCFSRLNVRYDCDFVICPECRMVSPVEEGPGAYEYVGLGLIKSYGSVDAF